MAIKKQLILESVEGEEFEFDREIDLMLNAHKFVMVLEDLREEFRRMVKYENKETIEIETVRDMIWKAISEDNLERFFV